MRVVYSKRNNLLRAFLLAPIMLGFAVVTATSASATATNSDQAIPVPALITPPAAIGAEKPIPLEQVNDIKGKPLSILAKFPEAGPKLARYIAEQVNKQPAIVDAILSVVNTTSPEQASAIGAGLVRAARGLGAKQGVTYQALSEKVQRTDNIWLKTSFEALGPNYRYYRAFSAPGALPPREYVGFAAGDGGALQEWKVGPAENELGQPDGDNQGSSLGAGNRCRGNIRNSSDLFCHGMIVANIGSNASSNGAVSTSPTL